MGVDSFSAQAVCALKRLAREEHFSVVLGAGASVAAGLPDWSRLIKMLLAERAHGNERVAESLVRSQGFLLAAEAAFDLGAPAAERKRRIAAALFGGAGRKDFEPTEVHVALTELARARGVGAIQLLTTNYDDLLERAFYLSSLPCFSRYESRVRSVPGAFSVHHLHGFLSRNRKGRSYVESGEIVLSQSDYDRIYQPQNDWPGEVLAESAARGPLLFIGTSLTDPNLVRYLGRIKDRNLPRAVQVIPRQGMGVSTDLFPLFGERLTAQWAKLNVEVVLVEDFSDVTTFVRELVRCGKPAYRTPAQRLRRIWSRANRDFHSTQVRLCRKLERQFRHDLQSILGDEATLSLWLADGKGSLVQFAANDRIHRSPKVLRRLPYRFDAGWAVTEAVSFGNFVLREIKQVPGASENEVPDQRWKTVTALPLRMREDEAAPLIAGALTSATVRPRRALDADGWLEAMSRLAAKWQDSLLS
jgi:hypothetical protein